MAKLLKILIITLLIVIVSVIIYYQIGIGFSNAILNSINEIYDANQEWDSLGINPLDSIIEQIKSMTSDSTLINQTNTIKG